MLLDSEIRQAIEFESDIEHPVLSVYLNVDPHRRSAEKYKLALRSLLSQAKDADPRDAKRVQNFIEMGYNWQGRGLVMFSCEEMDFWWAKSFMVPVADTVFTNFRPYVRQLATLIDTYERYGVVHVDSEGARIYVFNMGVLEAVEGYLGEEVKQHKAGGWSSARYQRHESGVARHNLQDAAEIAEDFYRRQDTRRLILAGTDRNVARFQNLLSHRLRSMVVGQISANANASPSTVSEKAIDLIRQASDTEAAAMADTIVTAVHKGANAVAGLPDTLTAVQNGRAQHVVVLSDFSQPAYRFVDNGYIVLDLDDETELGSGRVQELPDGVESVLRRAMEQGIGVTVLDEHEQLEELGSIAALTRY
jgi:peptide chain release factor subunit 1